MTVHGDDFTVVASAKQIAWLGEEMKKRYELKMEVLGPNAGQTEEVRVLNRIIRWTRTGLEYEPDQRHAERIISELELETCKSASTPRVQESVSATRAMTVGGVEMDDKEARRFRALAARLNYLSGDRPDLLFASKCVCKNMARPRSEDLRALETSGPIPQRIDEDGAAIPLGRRRHQSPRLRRLRLGRRPSEHEVHKWWCYMWSGHCVKAWSTSFAICIGFELRRSRIVRYDKSSSSALWCNQNGQRLWRELDRSCEFRDGLGGRCRHIKVQYLWIHSKIKDGDLKLQKVLGTNNVADAMTKAVDRWALDKYMAAMNFTLMPGRADISRSVVWHIFMNGIAFISTEEGCEDLAHASAYWRDALSPEAMPRMM